MWWMIFGGFIFSAISWYIWLVIHEFSHLAAAKMIRKVLDWQIWLYPHKHEGYWYFGRVQWIYELPEYSGKEKAFTKFAPRIPNAFAGIMFILTFLISWPFQFFWAIFWGAGLVDMVYGSIGVLETSDLATGSVALGISPWVFRIVGFVYFTICVIVGLLLLIL